MTTDTMIRKPARRLAMRSMFFDWLMAERRINRDTRRILELDDHLLRDIGLHDADVREAVRYGRR